MPDPKPGESRSDFVNRCIPVVLEDGTAEDQDQAVAICMQMWRDRGKSLVMKMTKVQKLRNGRIRWQARANTGEYDLLQERFDQPFFDDVIANFYETKEALSRGDTPPRGMTEPILDISHYSVYLSADKRNLARAGWIDKMWRDGRVLFSQGFFDDTRLGQLAAKAASERKPEDRRVSIVVYPDYSLVETETGGRKVYRGGNGKAWMDSLAMTSTPCDPGAVMEVRSMTTLREDAEKVLGEDGTEIVEELEAARTAKTLPDGALIKAEPTKTVSGRTHTRGDFLVVEDSEKTTTWHLPVKIKGELNPRLMGAAWAALFNPRGFRGRKYAGPQKSEARAKLRKLYESEGLDTPAEKSVIDESDDILGMDDSVTLIVEEDKVSEEETTKTEETPTEETPAVESQPLTMEGLQAALDQILPGIANAIDERFQPLQQQVADLAGKTAEFEAQIKALAEEETQKVKAALDGDGDWFNRMWGNSVQRSDAVKGEETIKKPKQTEESDFARLFGEPES